jgi:hypothetical protein
MASHLDLRRAPVDPVQRILWLAEALVEADLAMAEAYFEARLQGQLEDAIARGPHSRKAALAMTRQENERRGRQVRWGDGADRTSTAYSGR